MPTDAALLIGGPAIVTFDGATFYSEEDITVQVTKELKNRSVSGFGSVPPALLDVRAEISFRPTQWKNTDKLFPYFGTAPGTRIFGNTDKPLVIQSITEGLKYTWSRAALTSSPALGLGAEKDLLGPLTITAIKANATALSSANSVVAITNPSAFSDTSFDVTKLFDLPYSVAWGASPFNAIHTEDGVDVEAEYDFEEVKSDQGGLIDMRLTDVRCRASFIPVNLTHANLLTLQKIDGVGRGTRLAPTNANDLVIQGSASGQPKVTLVKAFVTDSGLRFGVAPHLSNALNFLAARTFSGGAAQAVAAVTTVA